jgi:hypothetical protein
MAQAMNAIIVHRKSWKLEVDAGNHQKGKEKTRTCGKVLQVLLLHDVVGVSVSLNTEK